MEGRTAVRPSGITPDFHAAFKQTWYKQVTRLSFQLPACRKTPGFHNPVGFGHPVQRKYPVNNAV